MIARVRPFGASAWLVEIERTRPADDARAALRLAKVLARKHPEAEIVVGGAAVLVAGGSGTIEAELVEAHMDDGPEAPPRSHTIGVVYDGADLDEVAARAGLTVAEVIDRHAGASYVVEVVGFLPGFAYLGELDARLRLPRRESPRRVVPAGSVAIAGRYSGVYPFASPGGWHLLGCATGTAAAFDATRDPPTLYAPGDVVRFVPTDARDLAPTRVNAPFAPADAHLAIVRCPPHATVQDRGRRLRGHGLPSSGPLDRSTHDAANQALGNPPDAATIELPIDRFEAEVLRDVWLSVDGAAAERRRAGDRLAIGAVDRAVRYLALEGGVDVPMSLGSRATLAVAGLGGLEGRRLRAGDRLRASGDGTLEGARKSNGSDPPSTGPIPLMPGPHLDRFAPDALERLVAAPWTVSQRSDRIGTRLEGGRVARRDGDDGVPEPVLPGAMQVSTDGTPIVLGPDAAVTGGYPVLAVLTDLGRDRLARARPGSTVRFEIGRG